MVFQIYLSDLEDLEEQAEQLKYDKETLVEEMMIEVPEERHDEVFELERMLDENRFGEARDKLRELLV